jgi:hypothetical protein
LLICIHRTASQHDAIIAGFLCANVLAHEHQELSRFSPVLAMCPWPSASRCLNGCASSLAPRR